MEAYVLDVSACMPWCCEDEATPSSEQTLAWAIAGSYRSYLHVPSLWPWEMMNAIAVAVRRTRIEPDRAGQFFAQLAARFQLTCYDTAYLDLAERLALPLATLDDDLKNAAMAEGVTVL